MNANEVIANRALEILGHQKGDYNISIPMMMSTSPNQQMMFIQQL
jgi:Aspartate ammonia-lyase